MSDSQSQHQSQTPTEPCGDFARLFMTHQDRIYSYVVTLVSNRADADDIFQEVGIVLWQKFEEFEPGSEFAAWACNIAHKKVLNYRKKLARSPLRFGEDFTEAVAAEHLSRGDLWDDRHEAMIGCMGKLRAGDQELLNRCYQPGASSKSIAAELGRPADTVYKKLARLRGKLAACIERALSREGSQ